MLIGQLRIHDVMSSLDGTCLQTIRSVVKPQLRVVFQKQLVEGD